MMMNQTLDESVLKPHYQLLGMLLERQELRSKLAQFTLESHSSYVRHDLVIHEIAGRIAVLDEEIRACYDDVVVQFAQQGRSEAELVAFVGDDLIDELVIADERQLA